MQQHTVRNLVVAHYGTPLTALGLTEHLDLSRWCITDIQSDANLVAFEQRPEHHVGVAVFPESHDAFGKALVQRVVSSLPNIKWIGVLAREDLGDISMKRFIAERLYDFQVVPLNAERLQMALGHAYGMAKIERELRRHQEEQWVARLGLIGDSPVMQDLFRRLQHAAASDIPVLISGPTGTGKEKTARGIHDLSARSHGPFIALNCAAIPPALVFSELFGHVKGAFTDATDCKIGHIQAASGGTLFLDEIGDMPLESQGALLRFIEDNKVTPLGSTESIPVDIRLIAATNKNLDAAVLDRTFRADLFYRIAVLIVRTPSLSSRGDDIALLAWHFLNEAIVALRAAPDLSFAHDALNVLSHYAWPGNVRELRSAVYQAVIECRGRYIRPEDLHLGGASHHRGAPARRNLESLQDARDISEKRRLELSLALSGSNITRTAKDLGVSRMTLYRLMAKHGVSRRAAAS